MQDVYVYSRKIHRLALFFTVGLGLVQLVTGIMMKFTVSFPFLSLFTARVVHNVTSVYFAVAFGVQMLTGLYMYIHPWIVRWRNSQIFKRSEENTA